MKKQILVLVIFMAFGVCVLYSLFALSPFAADITRQPFERNFDNRVYLSKLKEIDIKVNSFYLAGTAKNTLYLGNWTGPFHLVQVGIPQLDTLHMNLKVKDIKLSNDYKRFRIKIDSPYFYLSHGVIPGIYKGLISDRLADSFLPVGGPYFVDAVPVSPSRFVLKSFSIDSHANELATLTIDSPYFDFKQEVLQKQVDGIFCVDGILQYNKQLDKVVYLYAYRNEYIVMDTLLNVLARHHTIDTFSRTPIKVAQVKSKKYSTLASPPARINLQMSVSGNLLFVRSPLLAKNEDKLRFQEHSDIDVYELITGEYLYSFYLDNYLGHSPSSFEVFDQYLVAVYDHYLVLYQLNLPSENTASKR